MSMIEIYRIRSKVSYHENRIYDLERQISKKKHDLSSLNALEAKSKSSKNEYLTDLNAKKSKLSGLESISSNNKTARVLYTEMNSYLEGRTKNKVNSQFESVVRNTEIEKTKLHQEISTLQRQVRYHKDQIHYLKSDLRSALDKEREKKAEEG